MPQTDEKRMSCRRCQRRKIKCSRTSPCRRCMTAGAQCEYRDYDSKRAPFSREYVTALECRIASLERVLSKITSTTYDDVHDTIEDSHLVPRSQNAIITSSNADLDGEVKVELNLEHRWIRDNKGTLIYHAPSSVYNTSIMRAFESLGVSQAVPPVQNEKADMIIPRGHVIEKCLALYFHHLHPSFTLVDRDNFSTDFSNNIYSTENCCPTLVYALSALGSLMSDDLDVRCMADYYFLESKERLSMIDIAVNPATIQASLLCALYSAGRGDSSDAWFYSGIIMSYFEDRVHQQFRQDTCLNSKKSGTLPVNNDSWTHLSVAKIYSRILGLLFGRAAPVSEEGQYISNEILIKSNEMFESYTPMQDTYNSPTIASSSEGISASRKQYELAMIIHDALSIMFDPTLQQPEQFSISSVTRLNLRLCGWHDSLPTELRWDRWGSCFDVIDRGVAALHMLYHTARISLNRHILETPPLSERNQPASIATPTESANICFASTDTIISILQRYKVQYGLKAVPIVFVHGTISTADVLLSTIHSQQNGTLITKQDSLLLLADALDDFSCSWKLASTAKIGMEKVMANSYAKEQDSQGGPSELVPFIEHCHELPGQTSPWDYLTQRSDVSKNLEVGSISMDENMAAEASILDQNPSHDSDVFEQVNLTEDEPRLWAGLLDGEFEETYNGFAF